MQRLHARVSVRAAISIFAISSSASALASDAEERLEIMELMDRYGVVHDYGTPKEYADLFTDDGEIALPGGPTLVKGREALTKTAQRDHEKYVAPTGPNGENQFFMRHLVTNRMVSLTGHDSAEGSCYVTTMVHHGANGPVLLSFGRYVDKYTKQNGEWKIARREIILEFGNQELGRKLGFR